MSIAMVERVGETLEAAVVASGLGDRVELAFGFLDLRARRASRSANHRPC